MNLIEAIEGKEYIIKRIETDDEELNSFLFGNILFHKKEQK